MKDYIQALESEASELRMLKPLMFEEIEHLEYMIGRLKKDFNFGESDSPLYICDPEKNTACRGRYKDQCGIECTMTKYWRCAKNIGNGVIRNE